MFTNDPCTKTYIYCLVFNGPKKYCYIGSTVNPAARRRHHERALERGVHSKYMQNVYNKYGIKTFIVFRRTTIDCIRTILEHEYYAFFMRHGWTCLNPEPPNKSLRQYYFESEVVWETHQRRSEAAKRAMSRPETKALMSRSVKHAMSNPELRYKIAESVRSSYTPERHVKSSESHKKLWLNEDYRKRRRQAFIDNNTHDKMSRSASIARKRQWSEYDYRTKMTETMRHVTSTTEYKRNMSIAVRRAQANEQVRKNISEGTKRGLANEKARQLRKLRAKECWSSEEYRKKQSARWKSRASFKSAYHTTNVYHYRWTTERFEPWMHFIITNDVVTVFIWDTREVVFTCSITDLPDGYVRASDTYSMLIYTD